MAAHTIHKQEKEQFEKLFKQDRIDRFKDRMAILDAFLQTEHHVTVHELTKLVQKQGNCFSPDFVKDTIDLMCHYGFAKQNRFNNGEIRYEHHHLGQHHDHMICTKCKGIFEFQNPSMEQLQLKIAAANGFHLLQHKMELYGICRQCMDRQDALIPLGSTKSGERVVVKAFTGGAAARLRLLSMGLRIGDEIEIITNASHGQLVVAADFKRLVLGRGLAQKIQVSLVPEQKRGYNLAKRWL
ncbi:MAG: transcriptional repressor [Desulfobacteraceae bacterium]|jgi:Fur family ferric uptake transcriptional regulator